MVCARKGGLFYEEEGFTRRLLKGLGDKKLMYKVVRKVDF